MSSKSDDKRKRFPTGREFLRRVGKFEDICESFTKKRLSSLGVRAPKCWVALGDVLLHLDLVGSCFWNCPGGKQREHVIQYMAARVSSFGRASIRLAQLGFYDEALILIRSIGEIANLFYLFALELSEKEDWLNCDRKNRLKAFGPGKVRAAIAQRGKSPPISNELYSLLCEISTHPAPSLTPQSFNPVGRATVGGRFQEAGFLVVLNHLAELCPIILSLGAKLCDVPLQEQKRIYEISLNCTKLAGNVTVDSLPKIWKVIDKDSARERRNSG